MVLRAVMRGPGQHAGHCTQLTGLARLPRHSCGKHACQVHPACPGTLPTCVWEQALVLPEPSCLCGAGPAPGPASRWPCLTHLLGPSLGQPSQVTRALGGYEGGAPRLPSTSGRGAGQRLWARCPTWERSSKCRLVPGRLDGGLASVSLHCFPGPTAQEHGLPRRPTSEHSRMSPVVQGPGKQALAGFVPTVTVLAKGPSTQL